jgi:hemolysin III
VIDVRPRLRGVFHQWATIVGVPAFAVLLIVAPDGAARVAVAFHAVGVLSMLGVSGTYHSGRLSPAAQRVFKRIDHATILAAIGGTYVAITILALDGGTQAKMLWVVAVGVVVGVGIRMAWLDAPYPIVAVVYVAVGWSAAFAFPAYLRGTTDTEFGLMMAGGVLYTVGGVVYAVHRPNLWPATFGYHELFHALVVGGAACHYACVALLL